MDITDPDVQDELNAMSNLPSLPKPAIFGANRLGSMTHNPPMEFRSAKFQQPNRQSSPPPPIVLSTNDRATKLELEALLRKPAHTPEEKFLVLDARDKLIRLTTSRNVDIKRASSIKGVCPDMCPEKERLSREAKHRVASFELVDGSKTTMNHKVAVKEYSRSSADQEVPLPHELRPEPVLKLTMTYLLQNIMDLCDVSETNICDWYHFLWDRTRSIRKGITQQELCSPGSVLLVEQCARFHIHCAARLIAEEPQVFDQKINTENLTKCLQSLKYMYHDLGLKSIRCPNEAEFRAYVVLLNLHDSNFLWEVKQLPDDILHSPEIQFAIKVFLAIESNNYVKFFSLVRSTTYMNACILLRYFTQVRVKALQIMMKAYVPRNPIYMSISNLTYLLAFEDFEQCAQFMEYYGLTCDRDDDRILLNRQAFEYPDMPFVLDRAINVVEHKRQSTVGEVVQGSPLDTKNVLDKYEPHDSFDENGILLPKAWTAEDQDYYRPEARIDARLSKSDDNLFKMPTAPLRSSPRSSPRPRLSPKPMPSTDDIPPPASIIFGSNASATPKFGEECASPSTNSIFGSNKFTSTAPDSNNIFKTNNTFKTGTETNLFGKFNQKSQQTNLFGDASAKQGFFVSSKPMVDSTDGGLFKSSTNSPFMKPVAESSASIFSSGFSQKSESTTNLFSQAPKQSTNIFSQANTNNAPSSIFGGNSTAAQPSNTSIFGTQNASKQFGLFSKPTMGFGQMAGVQPLEQSPVKSAKETDDALQAMEELRKKQKEMEELEQKKKAEAEEKERQRKRKLEEEQKEKQRQELEQKRLKIEKVTIEQSELILNEFIERSVAESAQIELERHRRITETMQNIYTELENDVVNGELEKLAIEVKNAWNKNVLEKYFTMWRKTVRKRKLQRQKIENTPQWMPNRPINEILPELHHPLQMQTLSLMKRYRSGLPSKLVVPPMREDSIDLWRIIAPELIKLHGDAKPQQNLYWKCVISLPDNSEDPSSRSINRWLNNVFVRQLTKYPRRSDIFFLEQNIANGQRINVCMRTLSGVKMMNESQKLYETKDIDGTNAILFFMTTRDLNVTRARLRAILKAIQLNDAAGIIIYTLGSQSSSEIKDLLRLDELMDAEKIDDYVFASQGTSGLCPSTKNCLKYVATNSFYDEQLEMQKITPFLSTCLTDELWQRIYLSMSRNPTLLEASTRPSFLIDYYNKAIELMISMCTPSGIETPTLFAHELRQFVPQHHLEIPLGIEYFPEDWHHHAERHQQQLVEFLESLMIRSRIELQNCNDTLSMEKEILRFVQVHIPTKSYAERTAYKIIQHILAFLSPTPIDATAFKSKMFTYSWLNAFPLFTVDLLSFQFNRFMSDKRLPNYVIYDKVEFQEYTRTAWWLQVNENALKYLTNDIIRNVDVAVEKFEREYKRQKLDETIVPQAQAMVLEETLALGAAALKKANRKLAQMNEHCHLSKDISKHFDYELYFQEKSMRDTRDMIKELNKT